ncbi:MAG TPA: metallophosphoesterase [Planctomycetaceae bacterium]|nr:metallophosphoesterase [Planctomycetaceae bacterium]HRA88614.1 metallophosphoesterase [Planctomycetaceae bacterium]
MYDIIGDIHGYADELIELLDRLGYRETHGVFRHSNRKAVFCGDFIDRGPQIRDVLSVVRSMCEHDAALAVMGNHELNALAFHTPDPANIDEFLRRHNAQNLHQHQATLDQLSTSELQAALAWFRTLPASFDGGDFRVVHACWDAVNLATLALANEQLGTMSVEFLQRATAKGDPVFEAIERVLKGPEMKLPGGVEVTDKEGNRRTRARIRWFESPDDYQCGSYCLPPQSLPALANITVPDHARPAVYPAKAPPVFFGHYWLPPTNPSPLRTNIACLDYSVAKDGFLCGYRFNGESILRSEHFHRVQSRTRLSHTSSR